MSMEDLKEYELSFIVPLEDDIKAVAKIVVDHHGSVIRHGVPRKVLLSYPICKHREACFGFFIISLNPETVSSLNHDLNLSGSILRFIIVSPVVSPIPAPVSSASSPAVTMPPLPPRRREFAAPPSPPSSGSLTNEALEKKLEEILQ